MDLSILAPVASAGTLTPLHPKGNTSAPAAVDMSDSHSVLQRSGGSAGHDFNKLCVTKGTHSLKIHHPPAFYSRPVAMVMHFITLNIPPPFFSACGDLIALF